MKGIEDCLHSLRMQLRETKGNAFFRNILGNKMRVGILAYGNNSSLRL